MAFSCGKHWESRAGGVLFCQWKIEQFMAANFKSAAPVKKSEDQCWRDGSVVKSKDYSRGPGFKSQHPKGSSQPSLTPVPGTLTSSGLQKHQIHVWRTETSCPNTHTIKGLSCRAREFLFRILAPCSSAARFGLLILFNFWQACLQSRVTSGSRWAAANNTRLPQC